MAKKKVTAVIKLQCPAQKATPAPPIGPALGPHGVSAPQFVQQFNDKTKGYEPGLILPVIITARQRVMNLDSSFLLSSQSIRIRVSLSSSRLLQQQCSSRRLLVFRQHPARLTRQRSERLLTHSSRRSQRPSSRISMQTTWMPQRGSSLVQPAPWV